MRHGFDAEGGASDKSGMAAEALVPSSAAEAVQLFGDGKDITVFAGGTILMPEIAAGRLKPARTLLRHRSGLDELRVDGDAVRIGAMVPVAALVDGDDALLARIPTEFHARFGIDHVTVQFELGDAEHPCGQAPTENV